MRACQLAGGGSAIAMPIRGGPSRSPQTPWRRHHAPTSNPPHNVLGQSRRENFGARFGGGARVGGDLRMMSVVAREGLRGRDVKSMRSRSQNV